MDDYQRFRDRFGNDQFLYVGLVFDDVFTTEHLAQIQRLTWRIEALDGIKHVVSLANSQDVRSEDGEVAIRSIFATPPERPEELESLRRRVLSNPIHVGTLVSADGRATALRVEPDEMSEAEFRDRRIDHSIERLAQEEAPGARVLIAGTPPLKAATSRILVRDLFTMVPLGYAFMALVAWIMFRSWRTMLVPLAAISLAQAWTLAVMVASGRSLNLVTFIVPPLVNAVGFAYSVHVVSEFDEALRAGKRGPEAALHALRSVWFPVFLTGLTTAAGFLSLCLSPLLAIREFGAYCVVGVLASLVAALTFVPNVLSLLVTEPPPAPPTRERMGRWAGRLAAFDVRHRGWLLLAGAATICVAVLGLGRIQVSTSFTSNLEADHPLRVSIEEFDRTLAGSITLHVMLEGGAPQAFAQPENLAELRRLQKWLDAHPEVRDTASLADYLMVVNRALHHGDADAFALPEKRRIVSQILFFFWHDRLDSFVTRDLETTDILVRIPARPSRFVAGLLDQIEARLAELPAPLHGTVTGDTAMIVRTMDDISWGQAVSLSGASFVIFLILAIYFRSWLVAMLAFVPNAMPVVVYFGVLGLTGVTLNVITSLVACIVLGIAVDDTIHFLVRYREERESQETLPAAAAALRTVVRPVVSSTLALCGAFYALTLSGLRHMVEFGWLAMAMMLFALAVDLTFTPALASFLGRGEKTPR